MNFDRWANFYDIIYGDYDEDIAFYEKEAAKAKRVLELACGTGRIYLRLLKKGIDAYGIDISPRMIKILKNKAAAKGLRPRVSVAGMADFRLAQRFDLVIIPFRAFLHLVTVKEQLRALKNIRRHLLPGGRLILNFFQPDPAYIATWYGRTDTQEAAKGRYVLEKTAAFIDPPDQLVEITQELKEGSRSIFHESFRILLVTKREFDLLLMLAGFSKWKAYGGFSHEALTSSGQELVWIAYR